MEGFTNYFVTRQGLAVGLVDNDTQKELQQALINRADEITVKRLIETGMLAEERRTDNAANNNTLMLNGSVERIRQAVQESSMMVMSPFIRRERTTQEAAAIAHEKPSRNGKGKFWGRTPVVYVVRARKRIPSLQGPTEALYRTLKDSKQGLQAKELMSKHKDMAEITVRWALQALRKKGLIQSVAQPQTA